MSHPPHITPVTVSPKALSTATEIAALTERFTIRMEQRDVLRLRKINKIKSIQPSLDF